MDYALFFKSIRPLFAGGLTQVQVQVIEAILNRADALRLPEAHIAYILATGYGESKFKPVRENMNYSAARIREVWPTRPEAVKFAGKPKALANSVYGDRLGNRPGTDDGWNLRGGGVDQLTGRDNYRAVGIEDTPERILEPEFAAWSIVHGMTTGRYTGRKLADYGNGASFDARNARAIVNGDVNLNGATYAGYYRKFLVALNKAGWAGWEERPQPTKPTAIPSGHHTATHQPPADYVVLVNKPSKPGFSAKYLAAITTLFAAIAATFRRK